MIDPFRFFHVQVSGLRRLSPSFLRVTFTGDDLDLFADNGFDQRIKLVLPHEGPREKARGEHRFAHLPTGSDWYARWRALPAGLRNPFRTYTVRAVRHGLREVDLDIVMHEAAHATAHAAAREATHGTGRLTPTCAPGPVARWARAVRPGDEAVLLGPDARHGGEPTGIEFRLPEGDGPILLAGDETAVPAVASILERLPRDRRGEVLLEVPCAADVLDLDAPEGVAVTWLPRDGAGHGDLLVPAVRAAADRLLPTPGRPAAPQGLPEVDVDSEILWEVPPEGREAGSVYAWLAGEAAVIRTLRRHLVAERGLDRRSVAFMGYWRAGRAESA
ncbi:MULTISPECIES: siderophore-interacting protein [Streptosporangium]|uniref:Siderophore-interacting protein n=1 Tax=Streptosporangium jomthongense TaxID=1193683 RepID=A0ABV8FBV1_9ACTN